jgi:hypothetical protein
MKSTVCFAVMAAWGFALPALADSPAPDFGPNVRVFDPSMSDVQQQVDAIYSKQERNEFGPDRYALLFKPGQYTLDLQVGFYTQVIGLGQNPDEVTLTGAVRSMAGWKHGNATVNFWRAVENLSVIPNLQDRRGRNGPDVWAVSQGTWLRRFHVQGDLHLWDGGWSSGGFMADSKVDGRCVPGSQQQWISRNSTWSRWDGGVWNIVFVGSENPPAGSWPGRPFTVVDRTPVIAEKPYLYIDGDGKYFVRVPALREADSVGISWSSPQDQGKSLPLDQFYLAHPGDTGASINAAMASGKNLLLTPGVYRLETSIKVTRPGTIVLGLGYPTLIPTSAQPAMVIGDVDGVKVGGIIFDAGTVETPSLLQVGEAAVDGERGASHAADPIFLYDLVARCGGASPGITKTFVTINANNVVGDNGWFWRADHGNGAGWTTNKVANGLVVNGKDVTFYGLFVEHCQEYQTLWNGEGGKLYFYQSEMPYDPPSQAAWSHQDAKGFASYKVADDVKTHEAYGLGIYSYFTKAPVIADNAIETPSAPGVKVHHSVTVRLGGQPGSGIANVIDGRGGTENRARPVRVDQ